MSITTIPTSGTAQASTVTTINNNFTALATHHYGASAPSSPTIGYIWHDSDTPSATVNAIKIYDGTDWVEIGRLDVTNNKWQAGNAQEFAADVDANGFKITDLAAGTSANDATRKAQIDAMIQMTSVSVDGIAATVNIPLIAAPSAITISDVKIISDTATTGSGAGDNYTFQIENVTAANNLKASAKSTNGAEISANTIYAIGLDQNLTLTTGNVLRLVVTKTGSPTSLASAKIMVQVNYTVAC